MGQCLANQCIDSLVVQHIARLIDDPVLTVCRIRVQCHIGNDAEFGAVLLERANGTLNQPVRIPGLASVQGFAVLAG